MNTAEIGQRVKVTITTPDEYAHGVVKCLDGATGNVKRLREGNGFERTAALVHFDEPRPTWWSGQSPVIAFWIDLIDLTGAP